MVENEQVKPVKENLLTRVSRALLPVLIVGGLCVGGLYLFQPYLGLVSNNLNGEVFRGIGLSWKGLLSGESHGLVTGGVFNADNRLTRVSASSW